jgi:hypothetical protein
MIQHPLVVVKTDHYPGAIRMKCYDYMDIGHFYVWVMVELDAARPKQKAKVSA